MTSYHEVDGRMVPDSLPAVLPESAYKPIPGMARFRSAAPGRFDWCAKCKVAIKREAFAEHLRTVHPKTR